MRKILLANSLLCFLMTGCGASQQSLLPFSLGPLSTDYCESEISISGGMKFRGYFWRVSSGHVFAWLEPTTDGDILGMYYEAFADGTVRYFGRVKGMPPAGFEDAVWWNPAMTAGFQICLEGIALGIFSKRGSGEAPVIVSGGTQWMEWSIRTSSGIGNLEMRMAYSDGMRVRVGFGRVGESGFHSEQIESRGNRSLLKGAVVDVDERVVRWSATLQPEDRLMMERAQKEYHLLLEGRDK